MNFPPKHILSKSTFIRGSQCHKSLYLYKNYYHLRDPIPPERKAIFERGTKVGEFARQLFPGGVDASPSSRFKYRESVLKTQELIREGKEVIYEAAFQFRQVMVAIDILVKENGGWKAYEVKSSTKITPTYELDAAVQYYVITNAGIDLQDIFIVNINNKYVRKGALELHRLFNKISVKEKCLEKQSFIAEKIIEYKRVLDQGRIPAVDIGPHCFSPYECDFIGYCWKNVPKDSVFDIVGMPKEKQFELFDEGIVRIDDISEEVGLRKNQRIQVETHQYEKPHIHTGNIRKFLDELKYPLLFADFESYMPAIPLYENTRPYQQIPFQYSLHIQKDKGSEVAHKEFLAEGGADPRGTFIKSFLKDTEGKGSILVYNIQFERSVLAKLKYLFPEYEQGIDQRIRRLKDLMQPFKHKDYYTPEMQGYHSIKYVLPALVPELSYETLDVQNGNMAMNEFEKLSEETDMFRIQERRNNLLEYCKMDTLAMVKILEKLQLVID